MPQPLTEFPYTKDTYSTDQTSWTIGAGGKTYTISTSGQKGDHTAVCLFSNPTSRDGCFWQPQGSATMFYKQFDGKQARSSGAWVQIKLPAAKSLHTYDLWYNLMDDDTFKNPGKLNPPQSWVVLGSSDGSNWEEVGRGQAGREQWYKSTETEDGIEYPINAKVESQTTNKAAFTYFRFLFPNAFGRIDRIQMRVKAGPGSASAVEEEGAASMPETVDDGIEPVEDNAIMDFLRNNQLLLVGGAIAIVVVIMMMNR